MDGLQQLDLLNHVGSSILIASLHSNHILFSNTQAKQNFHDSTKLSSLFSPSDIKKLITAFKSTLPQTIRIPYPQVFEEKHIADIIYTDVFIDEITLQHPTQQNQRYAILTFSCTNELTRAKQILDNTKVRFTYINIQDRKNPHIILQSESASKAKISVERYFTTDSKVANTIIEFIDSTERQCVVIQDRSLNFASNMNTEDLPKKDYTNRHSLPDISELFDWKTVQIAPYYCEILITKVIDQVTGDRCLLFRETDITELKRKERQLKVELRRREAASDFISNLSHEIRTPLNGVQGMLEYLAETNLTYDQFSCVSIARSSTAALTNLLHDVLDFSKIEAGKLSIRPAPVLIRELVSMVEQVCRLFGTSVSSKGLSLYIDYPLELYYPSKSSFSQEEFIFDRGAPIRYIISDIMRVRQVLINLVSNAVKYTASGHVCVRLRVLDDFSSNSLPVHFEVEDTGEGIDTSNMSNIFCRFERVAAKNEEIDAPSRPEGTGIGLAIAKQITELLGGKFLLSSTIGEGSKFTLCLPRLFNAVDSNLTPKSRKDKNRFASAPHIGLFADIMSLTSKNKDLTHIEELRGLLSKVALNVICPHSKLLLSSGMEQFLRSCCISSCVSVVSPEELPIIAVDSNIDIIYILDIVGVLKTPTTTEGSEVAYDEQEWVNGVQTMIRSLYSTLFERYSLPMPLNLSVSVRSTHPANGGKLFLLIPLCCSRLIRRVLVNVPWFTSWISAPLIPSDMISLLCGKYNQQYIEEACPSPRQSRTESETQISYSVLAADDSASNRMVFNKLLSTIRKDIQVTWAKNGAEAVQIFEKSCAEKNPFDLCFMDLEMPKMNGLDAVRTIRDREVTYNVERLTVIALTANDTTDKLLKAKYISAGMDAGLSKPLDRDSLKILLDKYLPR